VVAVAVAVEEDVKHVVEGVVINTRAAQTVVCGSDNGNAHLSIHITTHDDRIGLLPLVSQERIYRGHISRESKIIASVSVCLSARVLLRFFRVAVVIGF
jgi:hypothetical protein